MVLNAITAQPSVEVSEQKQKLLHTSVSRKREVVHVHVHVYNFVLSQHRDRLWGFRTPRSFILDGAIRFFMASLNSDLFIFM